MLCTIGLHRWEYIDERQGDNVVTWGWCSNAHCPRYSAPMLMNVDFLPLPKDRYGDRA